MFGALTSWDLTLIFMGPYPNSYGYLFILVVVDYVSKWVEAIACKTNDHIVVLQFLKEMYLHVLGHHVPSVAMGGSISATNFSSNS
jgi:hypothetical protein